MHLQNTNLLARYNTQAINKMGLFQQIDLQRLMRDKEFENIATAGKISSTVLQIIPKMVP